VVRIVLIILLSTYSFAGLQYLSKSLEPQTVFESVSGSWNASDDSTTNVNLGFTFPFNGSTYSNVWINSNGMLSFSSSNRAYSNKSLPYTYEAQSIYPYWDDLNPRDGGSITYGSIGTGSNQHFVISWNAVPHYYSGGNYSFQIVLYENGDIRFRYDSSSSVSGSSATIGVQENTSNYDQHSYNSTGTFDASKDILYTLPSAKMSLVKSSCVIADLINGTSNAKRIPGSTIRFAVEVKNEGAIAADNIIVTDTLASDFDATSIENLQIQDGVCDCLGVASASNNGANGTANGVNPVKLDFGTVAGGSVAAPTVKCGYFEVKVL